MGDLQMIKLEYESRRAHGESHTWAVGRMAELHKVERAYMEGVIAGLVDIGVEF